MRLRGRTRERLLRGLFLDGEIFEIVGVVFAVVGVVLAGTPELGADVEVAVAIDVGCDGFVAAQADVEDDSLDEIAIDIFPDEPAGEFDAGDGFHFDGEDVELAIAVEIADGEGVIGASGAGVAGGEGMDFPVEAFAA